MFRCDYTDCKPKGNRQEVIMNTINSAAALSSTKEDSLKKLVFAGIFAALTYIVFTFLSIPIPTIAGDKVTVHLGNAFCVLGALILGSFYGGAGGALGLTIADLMDPVYIVQAPITFVIKFLMGILVGTIRPCQGIPLDSSSSCSRPPFQRGLRSHDPLLLQDPDPRQACRRGILRDQHRRDGHQFRGLRLHRNRSLYVPQGTAQEDRTVLLFLIISVICKAPCRAAAGGFCYIRRFQHNWAQKKNIEELYTIKKCINGALY